mgnify:CR=1 FL=1
MNYFDEYTSNYDMLDPEINYKYHHSYRVMDMMGLLATKIKLSEQDIYLATKEDDYLFVEKLKSPIVSEFFSFGFQILAVIISSSLNSSPLAFDFNPSITLTYLITISAPNLLK